MMRSIARAFCLLAAVFLLASASAASSRLESLVASGMESYDKGDFPAASERFEQALPLARAASSEELRTVLKNLSAVNDGLGDYPKALRYGEEALALSRKAKDRQDVAESLVNLGAIHRNQGDYKKAVACAQEALGLFRKLDNDEGAGFSLTNLAVAYDNLGRFDEAVRAYEQALALTLRVGDRVNHSNNLGNLAWCRYEHGDYRKALELAEQALEAKRRLGDKQGIANQLSNLGNIRMSLGAYRKALEDLEESLNLYRQAGDRKGEGIALSALGLAAVGLGDIPKGLLYLERALSLDREIGDRQGLGSDEENLGRVFLSLGDAPKAREHLEAALRVQREVGVPSRTAELALADLDLETGAQGRAEAAYDRLQDPAGLGLAALSAGRHEQALAHFRKDLQEASLNKDVDALFVDHCGLGSASLGLKDFAAAREHFEKAVALVEDQRSGLPVEDRSRFFSAKIRLFERTRAYDGLIEALAASGLPEEAFYYSESLKARSLSDAMARGFGQASAGLPARLLEEEAEIELRIRGLRRDLDKLYRGGDLGGYADAEKELARAKKERERFISKLRKAQPAYASLRYPDPARAEDLPLGAGETLLEFKVTRDKTFLFTVRGGSGRVVVREIPVSKEELQKLVRGYRSFFESVRGPSDLARYDAAAGLRLYRLLLGSHPAGGRLIIVPDDALALLPFESLPVKLPAGESFGEGSRGPFPLGVSYLGDGADVSYAQSAASLMLQRSAPAGGAAPRRVLAVCDPAFSGGASGLLEAWRAMGVGGFRGRGEGGSSSAASLFPRLEKTRELGSDLRRLFGEEADVLSGAGATKAALLASPLASYRLIVFGTHGILEDDLPYIREPALVLASSGGDETEGFLTMSDVLGLSLKAEVVALTACKTGIGRNVGGEGVLGLGRAFQYAGARDVLMSLWSVAEDGSVALARSFSRHLKDGSSPGEALRLARADVRREGFENPFYWSAFVLVGR